MKRLSLKQPRPPRCQEQQRLLALDKPEPAAALPSAAQKKCVALWAELLRAVIHKDSVEEGIAND